MDRRWSHNLPRIVPNWGCHITDPSQGIAGLPVRGILLAACHPHHASIPTNKEWGRQLRLRALNHTIETGYESSSAQRELPPSNIPKLFPNRTSDLTCWVACESWLRLLGEKR